MVEGKVILESVTFEDLMKMNILDKKEISLGELQLDINEQTKRTLEEEIDQKQKMQIHEYNNGNVSVKVHSQSIVKEEDEQDKETEEKTIDDGADDLII